MKNIENSTNEKDFKATAAIPAKGRLLCLHVRVQLNSTLKRRSGREAENESARIHGRNYPRQYGLGSNGQTRTARGKLIR